MKPSEMGLHSKVRWEINISGDTPKEHAKNIALFAEELYKFIYKYNHGGQLPALVLVTQKFARFVRWNLSCTTMDFLRSQILLSVLPNWM